MHIISAALCSFLCTSVGYIKAKSYAMQRQAIKALKDDMRAVTVQINLTSQPLFSILERIKENSELSPLWSDMQYRLTNGDTCRESFVYALEKNEAICKLLQKQEKEDISVYFSTLGKADRQTERKAAEYVCDKLEIAYERIEAKTKKDEKLFKSIGALLGLGLAIVLL